jgi:hypothetical protein
MDRAVGHEPRVHLVEPGSVERGILGANLLEHVPPEGRIESCRFILPPLGGLAKLGCRHGFQSVQNLLSRLPGRGAPDTHKKNVRAAFIMLCFERGCFPLQNVRRRSV